MDFNNQVTQRQQSHVKFADSASQTYMESLPTEDHKTYTEPSIKEQSSQTLVTHWLLPQLILIHLYSKLMFNNRRTLQALLQSQRSNNQRESMHAEKAESIAKIRPRTVFAGRYSRYRCYSIGYSIFR